MKKLQLLIVALTIFAIVPSKVYSIASVQCPINNFYDNAATPPACAACGEDCNACTSSTAGAANCLQQNGCYQGFFFNANTCTGTCNGSCKRCTDANTCLAKPFKWALNATTVALDCPYGYSGSDCKTVCTATSNCLTCNINSANTCQFCPGHYRLFGSVCQCSSTQRFNTDDPAYPCVAIATAANQTADTDSTIYQEGTWTQTAIKTSFNYDTLDNKNANIQKQLAAFQAFYADATFFSTVSAFTKTRNQRIAQVLAIYTYNPQELTKYATIQALNQFITTWVGYVSTSTNFVNIDGDDVLSAISAVNNMLLALKQNGDSWTAANQDEDARNSFVDSVIANLMSLTQIFVQIQEHFSDVRKLVKTADPEVYNFDAANSMKLYIKEYDPTVDASLALTNLNIKITKEAISEAGVDATKRLFLVAHVFNYDYQYFKGSLPLTATTYENNLVILTAFKSTALDYTGTVSIVQESQLTTTNAMVTFEYTVGSNLDYKLFNCASGLINNYDSNNMITQTQNFGTTNKITCTQYQLYSTVSEAGVQNALVKSCRAGTFLDSASGNCAACDSKCQTCQTSATTCVTCPGGWTAVGGLCSCTTAGQTLSYQGCTPSVLTTNFGDTTSATNIQNSAYDAGTAQKTDVLTAITTFLGTAANINSVDTLNKIINAMAKMYYQISVSGAEQQLINEALENLNKIQTTAAYQNQLSAWAIDQMLNIYSSIYDKLATSNWYQNKYYDGQKVNQKFLNYLQNYFDMYMKLDVNILQYADKNGMLLSESPSIVLSVCSFPNSLFAAVPATGATVNAKNTENKKTGSIQFQFSQAALQKIVPPVTSGTPTYPAWSALFTASIKGFGYQVFDDIFGSISYPSGVTPMYARIYTFTQAADITSGTFKSQEITGLTTAQQMYIGWPSQTGTPNCGTLSKFSSATQAFTQWTSSTGAANSGTSTFNCPVTDLDKWFSIYTVSNDCFPGTYASSATACASCTLAGCTSCPSSSTCNRCDNLLQPIGGVCVCASNGQVTLTTASTRDYACSTDTKAAFDALDLSAVSTASNYQYLEQAALLAYNQSQLASIAAKLSTATPNSNETTSGAAAANVAQTAYTVRAIGINPNFQNVENGTQICALVSSVNNVFTAILGQAQAGIQEYELLLTYLGKFFNLWTSNSVTYATFDDTCQTNFKNAFNFLPSITQAMSKLLNDGGLLQLNSQIYRKKFGFGYVQIQLLDTKKNFNQTFSPNQDQTGKYYLYFNMTLCTKFTNNDTSTNTFALATVFTNKIANNAVKYGPTFFQIYNLSATETYIDLNPVCTDVGCAEIGYASTSSETYMFHDYATSTWKPQGQSIAAAYGWAVKSLQNVVIGKGQWINLYQPIESSITCASGFYKINSTNCGLCSSQCATCSDSATKCTTCLNGRKPNSDGNCSCPAATPYFSDDGTCVDSGNLTARINSLMNGTTISTLALGNLSTLVGVASQNTTASVMVNLLDRTLALSQTNFTAANVPVFLQILQNAVFDASATILQSSWDNIVKITSQFTANPDKVTTQTQALTVLQIIGKSMEKSVVNSTATSVGNYQERSRQLLDKGVKLLLAQTDMCASGGSSSYKLTDNMQGSLSKLSAGGNYSIGNANVELPSGVWNSSQYNSSTACNVLDQIYSTGNIYKVADTSSASLYTGIMSVRVIQQSTTNKSAISDPTAQTFATNASATITFPSFNGTGSYACKYWTSTGWKTEGVNYTATGKCVTTHFTDFAITQLTTTTTNNNQKTFSDKISINVLLILAILSFILVLLN